MRPFKEVNYSVYERTFMEQGLVATQRYSDITDVIERNKRAYNAAPEFGKYKNFQTKVAEIPIAVFDLWQQQDGINVFSLGPDEMDKYIKRKLADPANKFFKTMPGNPG